MKVSVNQRRDSSFDYDKCKICYKSMSKLFKNSDICSSCQNPIIEGNQHQKLFTSKLLKKSSIYDSMYCPQKKKKINTSNTKILSKEEINFDNFIDPETYKIPPASMETLKNLTRTFLNKTNKPNNNYCTICSEEISQNESIIKLECSHCYHENCILDWLKEKSVCPMCRYELPA